MRDSYISKRVAGLKPSGIRKFFDIAATMKDVISLGIGEPDFTTPEPILEAGIKSLQRGETHYTSNSGILELRKALAAHLELHYGVSYDPANEIVITVGGSEALYLAATALLDEGDEMIIPTPCFVSYQAMAVLAGGTLKLIRSIELTDFTPGEIAGHLHPTLAYVEDQLAAIPDVVVLCGFGEDSESARLWLESELQMRVVTLVTPQGEPGEYSAGLSGYLESLKES